MHSAERCNGQSRATVRGGPRRKTTRPKVSPSAKLAQAEFNWARLQMGLEIALKPEACPKA